MRTVLQEEDFEAFLTGLDDLATRHADEIRGDRPRKARPASSAVQAAFDEGLRSLLADEIVPAVETEDGDRIKPIEFDHEVAKKALAILRLSTLRRVAAKQGVTTSGTLDELTARVAASLKWSHEEIARLVLQNEDEPAAERAHSVRLFLLEELPDIDDVSTRLEYVLGRYIRTGIARWFVFEELETSEAGLRLRGSLRSFRADVTDQTGGPDVVAVPAADAKVEIFIDGASRVLAVTRAAQLQATGAVRALAEAAKLRPVWALSPSARGVHGVAVQFSAPTLFMLDLIYNRFSNVGLRDRNLTVARFRMEAESLPRDEDVAAGPRLKAVRFEGSHLLDSSPACKLIAEGRSLVDVALTVQTPPRPDGETGRVPVRVAVETGHVLISTGFGLTPALSFGVQERVVAEVRRALTEGLADPAEVSLLAARIEERAKKSTPVVVADMLRDEDDL